jgi:hypothetical protein
VTKWVLALALHWHLAVLPLFTPKISGLHDAALSVSYAPRWHHIFRTGELEQLDGVILMVKRSFP